MSVPHDGACSGAKAQPCWRAQRPFTAAALVQAALVPACHRAVVLRKAVAPHHRSAHACPPAPWPLAQEVAQQSGLEVQPTPQTMRVIQDKYVQKQHFQVGAGSGVGGTPGGVRRQTAAGRVGPRHQRARAGQLVLARGSVQSNAEALAAAGLSPSRLLRRASGGLLGCMLAAPSPPPPPSVFLPPTHRRRACRCQSSGRSSAASAPRGRAAPLATPTCSRARSEGGWAVEPAGAQLRGQGSMCASSAVR